MKVSSENQASGGKHSQEETETETGIKEPIPIWLIADAEVRAVFLEQYA